MGSMGPPRLCFSFQGRSPRQLFPPSGTSRERPPWFSARRLGRLEPAEDLDRPVVQGGGRRGQRQPPTWALASGRLQSLDACAPACAVSEIPPGEPLVFGQLQK